MYFLVNDITLNDIITRLEALEGPDYELDKAIFYWRHPDLMERPMRAPDKFTCSIDAALTLVPEGWNFECGRHVRRGFKATLWGPAMPTIAWVTKSSIAIALCIAALKARQAMETDGV